MPPLFIVSHSQSNGLRLGPYLAPLLQVAYPGCLLLNKAVGGSSILSWQQGTANYNAALSDVRQLQNDFAPACIISVIGETDAKSRTVTANSYKALYWDALTDFRADIGHPYLPVVYVQLGTKPELVKPEDLPPGFRKLTAAEIQAGGVDFYPSWDIVQLAQAGLLAGHTAYEMVTGLGGYELGRPYCHRTAAVNAVQAEIVVDAIIKKVTAL